MAERRVEVVGGLDNPEDIAKAGVSSVPVSIGKSVGVTRRAVPFSVEFTENRQCMHCGATTTSGRAPVYVPQDPDDPRSSLVLLRVDEICPACWERVGEGVDIPKAVATSGYPESAIISTLLRIRRDRARTALDLVDQLEPPVAVDDRARLKSWFDSLGKLPQTFRYDGWLRRQRELRHRQRELERASSVPTPPSPAVSPSSLSEIDKLLAEFGVVG